MNPLRLLFRRSGINRSRPGLVAVVLASLIFSDFAAMRHVGNCCGETKPISSGELARTGKLDVCQHHGCDHGNPFRRRLDGDANTGKLKETDAVAGGSKTPPPCSPDHDRDRCVVCRWFVVISSGINMDAPVMSDIGEWVAEPFLVAWGVPAGMQFLPTVSRRGPPVVA